MIREAHKRGIPIDFKGAESQEQEVESHDKTTMKEDKGMKNPSKLHQRF